ncbi:hypothetical protein [Mycobacterium sp. pR1184]
MAAPGNGFCLLNTQGKRDKGEPEHNPELRINNDFGTEAIEGLIDSG